MKKITIDTMKEYAEKLEQAEGSVIPMLPFVRMSFHDFERYKSYSDKGIYLINYLGNEFCLYHLYHLSEGDDTLRATLILPSSWEKRFEIMEQSIPNLKEWFLQENQSKYFIIQSLEYGEIEYFPTLSHYLIPTIIRNGFEPKYRMYMKREAGLVFEQETKLDEGLTDVPYSKEMFAEITDFYFNNDATKNDRYFTNCSYEEFQTLFKQDYTIENSRFIRDKSGNIIAGLIMSQDSGKVWIDNYTVIPELDDTNAGDYLLNATVKKFIQVYPEETLYIYLNRDCYYSVKACEENGFTPFEFWTDMILER